MHGPRLLTAAAAAAALAACQPSIQKSQNPGSADFVVFDPSTSQIPLPNDLALQTAATQTGAQGELLQSFAAQGGFPSDQDLPVTIDVQRFTYSGSQTTQAPPPDGIDLATVVLVGTVPSGATVAVFEKTPSGAAPVTAVAPAYVQSTDRGTLVLSNKPHTVTLSPGNTITSTRWNAGSTYVVMVRGGANGVKLKGGGELVAMPTLYLLTRGVDLSQTENQYLLPGGDRTGRAATGQQLEALRQQYVQAGLIAADDQHLGLADQVFGPGGTKDLVSLQTFKIAPSKPGAAVVTDASAGVVPLPSDLLLDPATNKIVNNPAFGALASGLATLDGFSTTAMELTQTSGPVLAATVNSGTVFLYDLTNPAAPVRVKELFEGPATAGFVAEPYQMTLKLTNPTDPTSAVPCTAADTAASGCFSTAIGLQPAVPVPLPAPLAGRYLALPPLKEGTEYAVLLTDGVQAAPSAASPQPTPLQGSTLSRLLLFQNPLVDANGKSQVPGQTDAAAAGLEKIRQGVGAAAAALQAEKGIAESHVVLGYTFRTQTITQTSLKLAAAPYAQAGSFKPLGAPQDVTTQLLGTTSSAFKIYSVPLPTLNPIDVTTGALNPDNTKWTPAQMNALVVVPTGTAAAPIVAPLVVFQHGLGQNKTNVAALAQVFAGAGFVVAAIDAPLHGERAYCEADAECTCAYPGVNPAACTPKCGFFGPAGLQGDTVRIGLCTSGSTAAFTGGPTNTGVSGRFFVSQNLFRTRDALRQNVLDVSALILALAPPTGPGTTFSASDFTTIDSSKVYWIGQSLGGILGTLNTAVNPRISRTVLNVPGGTVTDIFTQSTAFTAQTNALLLGLPPPFGPIDVTKPTDLGKYLEFIQVAKLILDGGEPVNFAGHLVGDAAHPTLPDLLANKPNQAAKAVLGQVAIGDATIPNPFNYELLGNVFGRPLPDDSTATPTSNVATYSGPDVTHGMLLTPTQTASVVQPDAANFLLNPATLPATVHSGL